ncbi:MAG TPA: ubiquinol-cytochrome c reductase iron-sulfur subunit [Opitutaceae bacterium]|jgi:menaquinol-cytochrome c reductase iron-sulfur subunit|nr:ubiquinol-cytochrome c reductase iron-sulfur subunit [Opitutaceae bacterium]
MTGDVEAHAKLPQGPAPTPEEVTRRSFFVKLTWGLGALGAALVTAPVIGFIFAPLFRRTSYAWRSVGKVDDFKVGETTAVKFQDASALPWAGVTSNIAAWLRRDANGDFTAFAVNCTHLGCPVRWVAGPKLFMCPCHGGVYYQDGSVAAGPPPRALERYLVRVVEGSVQIQTRPLEIDTH